MLGLLTFIQFFFRELDPKLNHHLGCHLQTHLQILLLRESQFLSQSLTCLSTLTLVFPSPLHLLIVAYRPEFADNYQQEPAETHDHGPIVMPLPYFVDHHVPSMSSLRNGSTGNLIETESVFFCFHDFLFPQLVSFLFAENLSLFFLARARHLNINQPPIFKQVRIHNHVIMYLYLLSSILLPNRRLPTETPTLGTHIIMVLIQDFTL